MVGVTTYVPCYRRRSDPEPSPWDQQDQGQDPATTNAGCTSDALSRPAIPSPRLSPEFGPERERAPNPATRFPALWTARINHIDDRSPAAADTGTDRPSPAWGREPAEQRVRGSVTCARPCLPSAGCSLWGWRAVAWGTINPVTGRPAAIRQLRSSSRDFPRLPGTRGDGSDLELQSPAGTSSLRPGLENEMLLSLNRRWWGTDGRTTRPLEGSSALPGWA